MLTHRYLDFISALNTSTVSTLGLNIARDEVPGLSSDNVFGVNPSVGSTAFEDIWDAGGTLSYPQSGEIWEIVAVSGDDTFLGTGARTVEVEYLDDEYVVQSESVHISGVLPVPFCAGNAFRFRNATVTSAGSENINIGNIIIRKEGTGEVRGQINGRNGNSLDGHYTVPAGKTAYLVSSYSNIPKNQDAEIKLFATNGVSNIFVEKSALSVYQNSVIANLLIPRRFPEKSDLKLIARSSVTDTTAVASLQFILVEET